MRRSQNNLLRNKKRILALLLIAIFVSLIGDMILYHIYGNVLNFALRHPQVKGAYDIFQMMLILMFIGLGTHALFRVKLKTIIVNLVLIAVILYGFEFMFRRSDPFLRLPYDSGYYYQNISKYFNVLNIPQDDFNRPEIKNSYYYTWGSKVINNRYGFRERDFSEPKPTGVFRIMILGDSLTWGAGLRTEQRFSYLLEKNLKDRLFSENIEVLNFGFPSSDTLQEMNCLNEFIDIVKPDLLVVCFCFNDPQPKSQNYSKERSRFDSSIGKILKLFKWKMNSVRLSYVGDFIQKSIYSLAERLRVFPEWHIALDRAYGKESQEWRGFVNSLQGIKKTSGLAGIPKPIFLSLFMYLSKSKMRAASDEQIILMGKKWGSQALKAASEIGFVAVDTSDPILEKIIHGELEVEDLSVSPLDGHPSSEINKIYAQVLFAAIFPLLKSSNVF